ncbi:hypothetical protein [Nannocystis sp. SCPEA4]|uniref:hypothetical protein n=1 Tax=Nannocystis sp. SCPEA4 TaxID=2996787 RepID=UPI00227040E1|nr:hypothetical protein [Nannocystis sp. SCPEA4]MCY1057911.1 hypothetical protein [Nannocystis sp. SCPEA4]
MIARNISSVLVMLSMGLFAGSVLTACEVADPLPSCTPGVDCGYSFKCNNNGNKYYTFDGDVNVVEHSPPHFDVCAIIDPSVPGWEDEVKDECTARCYALDNMAINDFNFHEICEDSNWSSVEVYETDSGEDIQCTADTDSIDFGPVWDVLGGVAQAYAETLPCDLGSNCMDYLTEQARQGFTHSGMPSIESTADVQGTIPPVTSPGPLSSVTLAGETKTVSGAAAWSTTSCGYNACPFYLAQFDLTPASSMEVSISYLSTTLRKTISSANVSLERATMGLWLPSTGDVIFPPGSLYLRLTGTVSGLSNAFGENGNYDFVYPITNFVFGTLNSGELKISHSDQDLLGGWSLTTRFN